VKGVLPADGGDAEKMLARFAKGGVDNAARVIRHHGGVVPWKRLTSYGSGD
jgi:hypothetical protein